MFFANQFKIVLGRRSLSPFHQIVTRRSISKAACLLRKEDVYVQRMTERLSDIPCTFPQLMDLHCKVAIITGGETGCGMATADDLLANGAQMVVLAGACGNEGEAVVEMMNERHGKGRTCFMHMDVNDTREFEELFYRVNAVFGGVDIVFNNAGIMKDQVWEYEIDTNLKSVMRGTLLGFEYMGKKGKGKRKGSGVIINHSDVLAWDAFPYTPGYVATKAGIIAATQSFGVSLQSQISTTAVVVYEW